MLGKCGCKVLGDNSDPKHLPIQGLSSWAK